METPIEDKASRIMARVKKAKTKDRKNIKKAAKEAMQLRYVADEVKRYLYKGMMRNMDDNLIPQDLIYSTAKSILGKGDVSGHRMAVEKLYSNLMKEFNREVLNRGVHRGSKK